MASMTSSQPPAEIAAPARPAARRRNTGVRRWVRTPEGVATVAIVVLVAVNAAWASTGAPRALLAFAVCVVVAGAVDLVVVGLRGWGWQAPTGTVISGAVLGVVLDPSMAYWELAAAAAGAVLGKHLLRIGRRPVFNPAVLALVVAGLLGAGQQSWWGATAGPAWLGLPLLVVVLLVLADKVNRLLAVGAFLAVWFGLLTVLVSLGYLTTFGGAFTEPLVGMALFFAGVMLLDPPTSPGRAREQYLFGAVVAVVGVLALGTAHQASFLPIGLLAGNAYLAVTRLRAKQRRTGAQARAD
jgi:Na+-transporting NADH:ubiquinone oxidoreductase subunit NqrB